MLRTATTKQAQVLSETDIKRVLSAIAKRSYSTRDRAMFLLTLLAGMRVGEVSALKVSDVFEDDGRVKDQIALITHQTKGNEARVVLLNTQVQEELRMYARTLTRRGDEPPFVSKWGMQMSANSLVQVFGRFYKQAALSNTSSHSGLRSFCTKLCEAGTSIHIVAALAGHNHISTTAVYLTANPNIMRKAIELN